MVPIFWLERAWDASQVVLTFFSVSSGIPSSAILLISSKRADLAVSS